ncbi:MAG: allantoinase AllB [Candidatus Eisenbacteria bacterium]
MTSLALRSTRVCTREGLRPATIEVRDGRIVALHPHDAPPAGLVLHEAHDAVVMPGLVDSHVHINEPGRTNWEGFASATRAAAAGGITLVADMPLNSIPATVTRASLGTKRAAANGQCAVDVGFLAGVIPGKTFELHGLHDAGVLGFKCFLVPSGVAEFPPVSEHDLALALQRLAPLGAVLMAHAELPGPILAAATPMGTRSHAAWAATRPAAAETEAIALLVRLAEQVHARVHIVHVSSAESLPIIAAARARGVAITAETCPHYLTFTGTDVPDGATEYKCAPPLRAASDRDALWAALVDGTLDQVVSDHSPAPPECKARETGDFMAAWGGIASLQLGLSVVWTGMRERSLPLANLARWMSTAPAQLLGLGARKGALAPGFDADFVIWTPEQEFTVEPEALLHRHKLTPYAGRRLAGVVHATYLRGERVYAQGEGVTGTRGMLRYRELTNV